MTWPIICHHLTGNRCLVQYYESNESARYLDHRFYCVGDNKRQALSRDALEERMVVFCVRRPGCGCRDLRETRGVLCWSPPGG